MACCGAVQNGCFEIHQNTRPAFALILLPWNLLECFLGTAVAALARIMGVLWFLKLVERGGLQAQPATKFLARGLLFPTCEPRLIIPHSAVLEMEEVNSTNFHENSCKYDFSYLRRRITEAKKKWATGTCQVAEDKQRKVVWRHFSCAITSYSCWNCRYKAQYFPT